MEQFGKYQLVRRLGAGGMAEVFLARSSVAQGLNKLLVIKKIHPAFARSKHFVTMFVDEAKIALGLNHPNIVQVFDFGQVGDTFFLCMEYVEGLDLLRLMQEGARQGKRVPYGLSAYVVQQIAKGLDYAHRKADEYGEPLGIVHRDISPQNVLLSWDGGVKITDFGIARARVIQEEEGVVKGKFAYMSPEQARGDPVDLRSDIFSAGIVLFELACARPLFQGKGKEVLDAVKSGAIPRPKDCDPLLPDELEEIILKALAFGRDDRFATARDLQHALGKFQFHYAKSEDDLFDSGTLAQFVAQIVPRERPARAPLGTTPPPVERRAASVPGAPAPSPSGAPAPAGASPTRIASPSAIAGRPAAPAAAGTPPLPGAAPAAAGPAAPTPSLTPSLPSAGAAGETRERKHVLVLEGELSGLSSLRRQVGDARAKQTVADFFRIAEHIAYKHEALVHRTDDTGFTYLIGLPVAGEDDSSRAIRLALALVDALDGIGRDVEPELRLSVGIQRGSSIVKRRFGAWEYDLSAATTSIARRLAREAQGGEVLVGGAVYRVARTDWNFEELTTIDLPDETPDTNPGTHEDLDAPRRARVYRLRGPKEREQRMRERAAAERLVGREIELKALKDAYRDVLVNRRKSYVIIVGEAGVGKRSLVSAFLEGVPAGEALVLRAAARAATRDTPFAIVADLARDMLGLAEGAEPREVQKRLQMTAQLLYPGETESREMRGLLHTVGMLLGVKLGGPGSEEIDAEERRQRLVQALRRIEERLSQDRPLVIVAEDVHWADSGSWDVFMELLTQATPQPILGIATARPDERVLQAASDTGAILLVLDELPEAERVELVLDRFAPGEDARELAREITAKAGGNPFFIREMIDSLVERGILAEHPQHPGKLRWVRRVAIPVPTSAHALVATRLDRLPPADKETLTRAAVLGRAFAAADVAALVGRTCDEELARLVSRGLLDAAANGYAFRNEMTLEVAYDLLPLDERAKLHRRAAERILAAPGYRAGQDDAIVARHLELAGDAPAAAARYQAAAQHALEVRSSVEAFRHFTSALALLPRSAHAERFRAHAEREAILRAQARRPQQLREIHLMRREALALGDAACEAEALTRLAQFYLDVGKSPAARRTLGPALDAARRSGAAVAEAAVLRIEAALLRTIGQNAEALELCARALALCGDERRGLLERAQILNIRGTALWNMSRLREAIEAYAEALVIYRKLRVPRQEARALNNMGIVFTSLGEYEEAIAHYKRSLKIDQDLGDRVSIGLKLGNIGQAYLEVGELDKAEQYLTKALSLSEQIKDRNTATDATNTLGQVHLKRGDAARARLLFERSLELAIQQRNRYQEIRALVYLAVAQLTAGDPPDGALELARSATRLAKAMPMPVGEMYGLAVEGLALHALGRTAEAADRAAEAVQLLETLRDPEGAEEILWIHARLARPAGREPEARRSLERAHAAVLSKARRLRDPALRARYLQSPPARDITQEAGKPR